MQIFYTDSCPIVSAANLDDRRCIKMILESAQLLSSALILNGQEAPYKLTHKNHPCAVWARSSRENYIWLLRHFSALCNEYTFRYGKTHKSAQYGPIFDAGDFSIPPGAFTEPPNCTANHKHIPDLTQAYQKCLSEKWDNDVRPPTWYRGGGDRPWS